MSCHTSSCEPSDTSTLWHGYDYTFILFLTCFVSSISHGFSADVAKLVGNVILYLSSQFLKYIRSPSRNNDRSRLHEGGNQQQGEYCPYHSFHICTICFVGKIIDMRLGRVSIQEQTVSIEEHSDDFQPIWSWIEIKCSWIETTSVS